MKQPIKPEEIRVGDLVRAEARLRTDYAVEYRVTYLPAAFTERDYDWFLLDRPQPAPSRKAMVAALVAGYQPSDPYYTTFTRRIDEAWAKEGLTDDD